MLCGDPWMSGSAADRASCGGENNCVTPYARADAAPGKQPCGRHRNARGETTRGRRPIRTDRPELITSYSICNARIRFRPRVIPHICRPTRSRRIGSPLPSRAAQRRSRSLRPLEPLPNRLGPASTGSDGNARNVARADRRVTRNPLGEFDRRQRQRSRLSRSRSPDDLNRGGGRVATPDPRPAVPSARNMLGRSASCPAPSMERRVHRSAARGSRRARTMWMAQRVGPDRNCHCDVTLFARTARISHPGSIVPAMSHVAPPPRRCAGRKPSGSGGHGA